MRNVEGRERRGVGDRGVAMGVVGLVCRFGRGEGEHAALDGLDLEVPRGEVTAVVGPSGAGKSTLLRVIAGLVPPDAGDVRFDGRSVLALPPEKRRLGVVFQSYALFPHLTVAENVAFPLRVRGVGRRRARQRIGEVLERLEIAPLAERHPHQLSGGERQRVALARALAAEPRALLLDEPLAALDARLRLALREELARRLRAAGLTALYVTHDQEEAMALGDRVAVLRAGRLEQVGTPETLYRSPATPFVATFFGEANFLTVRWEPQARRLSGPLGTWTVDEATARRFGARDSGARHSGRPPTGGGGGNGAAPGAAPPAGRPARLVLRPESFRPAEGGPIRGRVLEATFLGGRRRLVVAVEGLEGADRLLKVDLPPVPPRAPGDLLPLEPDLSAAALLPAEGDREEGGGAPAPAGAGIGGAATAGRAGPEDGTVNRGTASRGTTRETTIETTTGGRTP